MKRSRLLLVLGAVGLAVGCLFPESEYALEFDSANLRLQNSTRYRSRLFGFVLWERYSLPEEHPTGARLRTLGVLPPIREEESRWILIKQFTSGGRRSSKGTGSYFLESLGATTFGTPVTLSAAESLDENIWVRWAVKDPTAAKHFWQEVRVVSAEAANDWKGVNYLLAAREYLEQHKLEVVGAEVEAHARQAATR